MSDYSSGRSYSDKLADLHIFIVPAELFLDKYRTAFNNIALESVSAGFVRVPPNDTVYGLRDHIEEQLGFDIVPEDFVYLRSVGRCMAVVKQNQERLLKIKDFLPPVAFSPEIFLLPGTHESVARPASDASNVIVSTHGYTTAGLNSVQPEAFHFPNIPQQYSGHPQLVTQHYGEMPQIAHQGVAKHDSVNSGDSYQGEIYDNGPDRQSSDVTEQQPTALQNSYGRRESDEEKGVSELSEAMQRNGIEDMVDSEAKLKQKNKKQKLHKKHSSDSSDGNEVEASQEGSSKARASRSVKFIQPEVVSTLAVVGPNGSYMSPPTPIPSGRVISTSPMPTRKEQNRQGGSNKHERDNKSHDLSLKNVANVVKPEKHSKSSKKKGKNRTRSPSIERHENDYNDRNGVADMEKYNENGLSTRIIDVENIQDRSKYCQFPSPIKGARRPPDESEMDSGIAEDYGTPPFNQNRLRGAESEYPSDILRKGGRGLGDQQEGSIEGLDNEIESDQYGSGTTGDQDSKGTDVDRGKDIGGEKGKNKKKAGPKKTLRKVENIEETFQIPNTLTPPPLELPAASRRDLEKDTASARDRKQQEVERLRGDLRKSKHERMEVEKHREQFVRRAKNIQSQTLQKRNQAKNVWKKRFFDEKRKTQPLEEQVNRLRYEVDIQHKALMAFLDKKSQEGKGSAQQGTDNGPSENTNQRMMLVRMQHDVEDLRRRIEETKMKLTSEMKMRDQAQKELKQLREDLMEKKINVTLTKSQKSLQTLISPENIPV